MGTDLFVMPLWRWFTGEYETQIESLMGGRGIIAVVGGAIGARQRLTSRWARWRARRKARAIARHVAAATGRPIDWPDEGDVLLSQQFRTADVIMSYLHWLDRRDVIPEYVPPPNGDYARHPFYRIEPNRTGAFVHLGVNPFYNDYWLPCDFPAPVDVEEDRRAFSTVVIRRELDMVNETLQCPPDYQYTEDDPLALVKETYRRVVDLAELSLKHRLPVIFWS